jgi:hypothetical protein
MRKYVDKDKETDL